MDKSISKKDVNNFNNSNLKSSSKTSLYLNSNKDILENQKKLLTVDLTGCDTKTLNYLTDEINFNKKSNEEISSKKNLMCQNEFIELKPINIISNELENKIDDSLVNSSSKTNDFHKNSNKLDIISSTAVKRRASMVDNFSMQNSRNSLNKMAISQIQEFVETSIVLKKDKNNELGISIIGGADTYLESICVCKVHENSATYEDGRIKKGDLILAVNEYSFKNVNYLDAVRVLKEANSPLKLLILRENPQKLFTTSLSPTKFITVELKKTSIKDKLGLSLMQKTNGKGVFVTYVVPGSIAATQGRRIMQGDQIIEINGQSVRDLNQKDVANQINDLDGEIVLLLGRVPSFTSCIQDWCRKKMQTHLKTRTSTWSAYGNSKDSKVQNQRPSLPVAKETPRFKIYSPDNQSEFQTPVSSNRSSFSIYQTVIPSKRPSRKKNEKNISNSGTKNLIEASSVVAASAALGSTFGMSNYEGLLFQQVSQQLKILQEEENKKNQIYENYIYNYDKTCFNTSKNTNSLNRSASVKNNNYLSVLKENSHNRCRKKVSLELEQFKPDKLHKEKYSNLFNKNSNNLLIKSEEILNKNFEENNDNFLYKTDKKFITLEDRAQNEFYEKQSKQFLSFKEEKIAEKTKNKNKQLTTFISSSSNSNRQNKRNFLLRRSNSSKTTSKTKKSQLPSIKVTEF